MVETWIGICVRLSPNTGGREGREREGEGEGERAEKRREKERKEGRRRGRGREGRRREREREQDAITQSPSLHDVMMTSYLVVY